MAERIHHQHTTQSHTHDDETTNRLGSIEESQLQSVEINARIDELLSSGKTVEIISQSNEEAQQFVEVDFEQTSGE